MEFRERSKADCCNGGLKAATIGRWLLSLSRAWEISDKSVRSVVWPVKVLCSTMRLDAILMLGLECEVPLCEAEY